MSHGRVTFSHLAGLRGVGYFEPDLGFFGGFRVLGGQEDRRGGEDVPMRQTQSFSEG